MFETTPGNMRTNQPIDSRRVQRTRDRSGRGKFPIDQPAMALAPRILPLQAISLSVSACFASRMRRKEPPRESSSATSTNCRPRVSVSEASKGSSTRARTLARWAGYADCGRANPASVKDVPIPQASFAWRHFQRTARVHARHHSRDPAPRQSHGVGQIGHPQLAVVNLGQGHQHAVVRVSPVACSRSSSKDRGIAFRARIRARRKYSSALLDAAASVTGPVTVRRSSARSWCV